MNPKKYNILKRKIGNLTTKFGDRTRDENFHKGIDIANAEGTPIPALADGTIISTGSTNNGLGNITKLKDTSGNIHQYGHLLNIVVRPGQKVHKGKIIALMGSSGNSYSPTGGDPTHTDIRIKNKFGQYKNPLKFLNK